MAREHANSVILCGPISDFKVWQQNQWGTKTTFKVNTGDGPALQVSATLKFDWLVQQGQAATGVVITNGFMNGWVDDRKNPPELKTRVEARSTGVYFFNQGTIAPIIQAYVEGRIINVGGGWLTLGSMPKAVGNKPPRERLIAVRHRTAISEANVGEQAMFVGVPRAKFGENWYGHFESHADYLLGKKG